MDFLVEDGTGVINANSYASVEFADDYFETTQLSTGTTEWADLDEGDKQVCLILATRYINIRFGFSFRGTQTNNGDEYLIFPRDDIGYVDSIPKALKQATCEYALIAKSATLIKNLDLSTGAVTYIRKKLGPLEKETHYSSTASALPGFPAYPAADALLRGLLRVAGNRLVR